MYIGYAANHVGTETMSGYCYLAFSSPRLLGILERRVLLLRHALIFCGNMGERKVADPTS